jgi:phage recombination protein Bet
VADYTEEQLLWIAATCPNAPEEFKAQFVQASRRAKLDPLAKQIYAINQGGKWRWQVSIDGLRVIADRTGQYSPGPEPRFDYSDDTGRPFVATVTVKKRTPDGTWHDVAATAYWDEYVARGRDGNIIGKWRDMPHLMLSKCAEALALRRAFPADMSGLYVDAEMMQAANGEPTEQPAEPARDDLERDDEQKNREADIRGVCYLLANTTKPAESPEAQQAMRAVLRSVCGYDSPRTIPNDKLDAVHDELAKRNAVTFGGRAGD